jgi:hypothetical protein
VFAVGFKVAQDEVDGLAGVLGRAALGAALTQGDGQAVYGGLDILKLSESLGVVGRSSRLFLTAAGGLGRETKGGAQLLEEFRTACEDLGDASECLFAQGGCQDGSEAVEGLEDVGGGRRLAQVGVNRPARGGAATVEVEIGAVEREALVVTVGRVVENPLGQCPHAGEAGIAFGQTVTFLGRILPGREVRPSLLDAGAEAKAQVAGERPKRRASTGASEERSKLVVRWRQEVLAHVGEEVEVTGQDRDPQLYLFSA